MYWSTPYHHWCTVSTPTSLPEFICRKIFFLASYWCFIWAILHNEVLGQSRVLTQSPGADDASKEGPYLNCPSTPMQPTGVALLVGQSCHDKSEAKPQKCIPLAILEAGRTKVKILVGLGSSEGMTLNLCNLSPSCSWVMVCYQSSDKISTADGHHLGLKRCSSCVSILCPVSL